MMSFCILTNKAHGFAKMVVLICGVISMSTAPTTHSFAHIGVANSL